MLVTKLFGTNTEPDLYAFTRRIDGNVAELPALPPAHTVESTRWNTAISALRPVLRPVLESANRAAIRILPKPELDQWSARPPALPPIPMRRAS